MNILSRRIGPPSDPPNWFRLNGGAPSEEAKNGRESNLLLRRYSKALPCHWFVPEVVTTVICPPLRLPYSAPYLWLRTLYSRTASTPINWSLIPTDSFAD